MMQTCRGRRLASSTPCCGRTVSVGPCRWTEANRRGNRHALQAVGSGQGVDDLRHAVLERTEYRAAVYDVAIGGIADRQRRRDVSRSDPAH